MHRSLRLVLSFFAAALAASSAVLISQPALAADTDVRINEVESNGGSPGDWIEITNVGTAPVDISGFGVRDNDTTHLLVKVPADTRLAPGGYYVFDTDALPSPNGWGLGQPDSANLPAAPVLTGTPSAAGGRSAAGWFRAAVTVTFTCTLEGSPMTSGCPAPVELSSSGADQSVTRTATSPDGVSTTVTVRDIDIDLVAPTVAITGVTAGATYKDEQHPVCVGSDALSGLASCTVTQERRGKRTVVVTAVATDLAGNVSTTTLTYEVRKREK